MAQSELLVVVDENDNFLEFLDRDICHAPKNPRIHREVFILLKNKRGELLLQKRSMKKDSFPGFWTLTASGHVAKGDTYEDAAQRELFEEVGINTKLNFEYKYLHKRDDNFAMIAVFEGDTDGNVVIDKEEVEKVGFFNKEELKQIKEELTPAAREVLLRLNHVN